MKYVPYLLMHFDERVVFKCGAGWDVFKVCVSCVTEGYLTMVLLAAWIV